MGGIEPTRKGPAGCGEPFRGKKTVGVQQTVHEEPREWLSDKYLEEHSVDFLGIAPCGSPAGSQNRVEERACSSRSRIVRDRELQPEIESKRKRSKALSEWRKRQLTVMKARAGCKRFSPADVHPLYPSWD
jgi:hypothetical protein